MYPASQNMDRLGCIIRFHLYTGTKIQKVYTLLPHEAGLHAKRNTHGPNRTNIFNGCLTAGGGCQVMADSERFWYLQTGNWPYPVLVDQKEALPK